MITVFLLAAVLYGMANYYSPAIVLHVVEQTLIQKAPQGTDPALVRERLHALLSTIADQKGKMTRLLQISSELEKVQSIDSDELNRLLALESRQ